MKNRKLYLFQLMAFLSVVCASNGFPLEKITHQAINENIAGRTINGFSLNEYLTNEIGFKEGIKENLKIDSIEKTVSGWLSEGGKTEDEPDGLIGTLINQGRSNNHFHNPLRPWNGAGLDDTVLGQRYTGQSSIIWAQNAQQNVGGNWSWQDARKYFSQGLTSLTKSDRDSAFAKTFKSLGQVMHLVEDASVPAHSRNDIHVRFNYEKWVEKIRTSGNAEDIRKFNEFISQPISFDKSILKGTVNSWSPIPIAKIIDTEQYIYTDNPQVTNSAAIGIAEYTNANFFSEGTVFNDKFPFPALASATVADYSIPDPRDAQKTVVRKYYKKTGDGDVGYRLATTGFLWNYMTKYFPSYKLIEKTSLDGGVYEDYAMRLLPRAVGYAAGLLEYFFRGNLQVAAIPLIYQNRLSYVLLNIKNITPDEDMVGGAFTLTYRYTPPGAPSDGSADIFGQGTNFDGTPTIPCTLLKSGNQEGMEVYFRLFANYIPVESLNSLRFTLAFKGKLGKEDDAVIGKVFSPWEIKFNEDWDRNLTGNYPWAHTGVNLFENPNNGSTYNVIVGDTLIKDNIRFIGETEGRVNESFVSILCCNDKYKPVGFPIRVTPNTYVMFKIDAMSINQITPAPPGATTQWQGLWMYFSNGLTLEFTQDGQGRTYRPNLAGYTFSLGAPIYGNIYELFQIWGIPIPVEPFYLQGIEFGQQLWDLGGLSSTAEYWQHMEVDYIRIVEMK